MYSLKETNTAELLEEEKVSIRKQTRR